MPHKDPEARRKWKKANYQKNKKTIDARPCRKAAGDRWRRRNRSLLRAKGKESYWANREIMIDKNKEWWRKKGNEQARKDTKLLADSYVKKQLRKKGYTTAHINQHPEIINTYREILKTHRLCKTSQN